MQINLPNLSTRQLKAFVTLARLRSFTHAAAECHLSQPAFSAMIKTLERDVDARLFDRHTRNVELTAQGRMLLDAATRLLRDLEDAMVDLREHSARRRGRVAIAVLPSLAAGWLPDVLAAFHADYPGIELNVADRQSEECVDRVRAGKADFALAAIRAKSSELKVELFYVDRFHLVCRHDHPLACRKRVTLASLANEPFIHLSRSSSVRERIERTAPLRQMKGVMELEQLSSVAGMVRASLGVTLAPALTLSHFQHPELVTRPIASSALHREIFMIQPYDRTLSVAAQALYDLALAHRP